MKKTALVTGGTSGVGRAIAVGLARSGARVVIVSHSAERGDRAAAEIRAESGSDSVSCLTGDLGSLASVRDLATSFQEQFDTLHVLSNNAAIMKLDAKRNADGVNEIIAVNYLSHFLLTSLLTGLLKRSAPSRVLTVTGQAGLVERVKYPESGLLDVPDRRPLLATMRAVLAKTLFGRELARRLDGTRITSNVFHPGGVRSGLASSLPALLRFPMSLANHFMSADCPTGVLLATDEKVATVTGSFFASSSVARYRPPEDEESLAGRLWEESLRLCGLE